MASIVFAVGCSRRDARDEFQDTANLVAEKSGHKILWRQGTEADKKVDEAISAVLANDLTVNDALQIALLNNGDLQATFEDIGIAQADLVDAGLLSNPTLHISRLFLDSDILESRSWEYGLTWEFLDLFFMPLRKKVAAAELEKVKRQVVVEVLDLAHEVQEAFYDYQTHLQTLAIHRLIAEGVATGADLARRQLDAGNISSLTFSEQYTAYLESRVELSHEESELRISRERLNRLMGLWGEQTAWRAAPELPAIPASEMSLDQLEAIAIQRRIEFEVAEAETEHLRKAFSFSKWSRIPNMVAGISLEKGELTQIPQDYGSSDSTDVEATSKLIGPNFDVPPPPPPPDEPGSTETQEIDTKHDFDEWHPSLEVEIPIFDRRQGKIARADAELRQAQHRLHALAVRVRSEVREARENLRDTRALAEFYRDHMFPERQKAVSLAQSSYDRMHLGNFELLEIKFKELETQIGMIEATRDYWIARAKLERAIGGVLGNSEEQLKWSEQLGDSSSPKEKVEHD